MYLDILKSRIHGDIIDMKKIVEMSERLLTVEGNRLVGQVSQELEGFSGTEKEFMKGWYSVDTHRLDKVFTNIQRRAFFTTAMCMTEMNLLLTCEMCQRAFNLLDVFKKRVIRELSFRHYSTCRVISQSGSNHSSQIGERYSTIGHLGIVLSIMMVSQSHLN